MKSKWLTLKMAKQKLQKISVWKMVLFSIITLGIYNIFWVYRRGSELKNLERESPITDWFLHVYLIIWIFGLILYSLFLTKFSLLWDTNNLEVSGISALVVSFAFLIMICLEYKRVLDDKMNYDGLDTKLSGFFTVVFTAFYIQYEINRILNKKESKPRKGPITCAIILFGVVLPLVLIFTLIKAFI